MASSLTFQLRQQQKEESNTAAALSSSASSTSLPSPPSSSCGDDSSSTSPDPSTHETQKPMKRAALAQSIPAQSFMRRDSLGTQLSGLSLMEQKQHQPAASLPENYTIDHSAPIPIIHPGTPINSAASSVSTSLRRPSLSSPRDILATSPAGRPRRPSEASRKLRVSSLSESAGRKLSVGSLSALSESSGRKNVYRCEECGKPYKHANCLYKHRWEHSEQWAMTSKLNITKHQQVQLLEAAAILVNMDQTRRDSHGSLLLPPSIKSEEDDIDEELEIGDGEIQANGQSKESRESTLSLDTEEDEEATEDDEDMMMMEGL
ncbi:hypothetical protein NQZ79_g1276 [Umbelopsis isabellina]|nr:hypothetical protein NQZ79_g1276 [Umbelopsis isabellina]